MKKIEDLFHIERGKGGYIRDFNIGNTPLVSATNTNNGIVGYVDDEPKFRAPAITVERVRGTAFVQSIDFSTIPDDISVLIPKNELSIQEMYAL